MPEKRPAAEDIGEVDGETIWRCPLCGYEDDFDGFDVMGADEDSLFCNSCSAELRLS